MFKIFGLMFLLGSGGAFSETVLVDSFNGNSGSLNERLPDTGSAEWSDLTGSFVVTNGVLSAVASGLASAWMPMPVFETGEVIRVSAVVAGNGDANTDYVALGFSETKNHLYVTGGPWESLYRRVDSQAGKGYLRLHSGAGSSGTNLMNLTALAGENGFVTNLNARNSLAFEYHTGSGNLSLWLTGENGVCVQQYNGPVNYGGVSGAVVPAGKINYLTATFNSVNPAGATNPAFIDDLLMQIIPVNAVRAGSSTEWTFSRCSRIENNTLVATVTNRAYAQGYFYGTGVELFVRRGPSTGSADVYVDGRYMARIYTASSSVQSGMLVFSTNGLRRAGHVIRIVQVDAPIEIDYISPLDDGGADGQAPNAQASTNTVPVPDASLFSGLTILQSNTFPHVFHFRKSEADALTMPYTTWTGRYSNLMGVIGKMYNEDEIHLSGTNGDFPQREIFRQYKDENPSQLALLHFDAKYRNIATERATSYYAPQHFLYFVRQPGYSDLDSVSTQSVIQTTGPVFRYFRLAYGDYRNEDVVLVGKAADGSLDWSRYEYTRITGYTGGNPYTNKLDVARGCYGSSRLSWTAGGYYLLVPVSGPPWDIETNNHWMYNFTAWCPTNAAGKTCADVFCNEIAGILIETNDWSVPQFDGVEFDIIPYDIQDSGYVRLRGIDSNLDGVPDYGYSSETNMYGSGLYEMAKQLRQRLGNGKLILADGGEAWNQRCFGLFNGIEKEGLPVGNDGMNLNEWTEALNRLRFWNLNAYGPAFSYVNWKLFDDGVWHSPSQNVARLNLATFTAYDIATAFYSYKGMSVPTNVNDEAVCGTNQITGWLGAPSGPAVCLAPWGTDLLGGGGVSVSADFTNRIQLLTGDLQLQKQGSNPYNLKISSSKDGRIAFRIRDVDVSTNVYPELTCRVDVLSEKSGILPSGMHRQFVVRALDSQNHVIKECSIFAANAGYMPNIIYFSDLGTNSLVHLEFDFEGCGYVQLRNTKIYNREPSFYREFANGYVAGNPSDHPVTVPVPGTLIRLTAQDDIARADYDQAVNNGVPVTNSILLGARDGIFLKKKVSE
jgi:hypothetical protein